MKSFIFCKDKLKTNRKGVFGMTSVQSFFAIILGVALLAYVIVAIMGTLLQTSIIPAGTLSATVTSEAGWINSSGYPLALATTRGFGNPVIVSAVNTTSQLLIPASNYSVNTAGLVINKTDYPVWKAVSFNYTYTYDSGNRNNANDILSNTSTGISGFFGSMAPVYAILAILVIILVLVVLVRVVTGEGGGGKVAYNPQL